MLTALIGPVALFIRIFLYMIAGHLASLNIIAFNEATGGVAFNLDNLSQTIAGAAIALVTFGWSRAAKKKGGTT